MRFPYDVAVLGGGASGLVAAGFAGLLGAKVALIEPNILGGECTWSGCIPSKALLHLASLAHATRTMPRVASTTQPQIDFAGVMERVRAIREEVYEAEDAPPNLARYGAETFRASAHFVDAHTIALNGEGPARIQARWFVIATGSRPKKLPGDNVRVLDNETIWDLKELPSRLLILGAGPVAIEMAQAFARLGSRVMVTAPEERILLHDDEECAAILKGHLEQEGVTFTLGTNLESLETEGREIVATFSNAPTLRMDAIFAAIGREARTEGLGLETAGVDVRDGKIVVDRKMRTSRSHIYAVGDVASDFRFTHVGERMSTTAISHALLRVAPRFDESERTWVTFTDPELAHVGISEKAAGKRHRRHRVFRFPFQRLDRALTDDARDGLVKVVATPHGRILGATIVGSRAGDAIAELALARKHRIKLAALSGTLHGYPTYALGNRRAADEWWFSRLSPFVLGMVRRVARLRGRVP